MEIPLSDSKERDLTAVVEYILRERKQVSPKMILKKSLCVVPLIKEEVRNWIESGHVLSARLPVSVHLDSY